MPTFTLYARKLSHKSVWRCLLLPAPPQDPAAALPWVDPSSSRAYFPARGAGSFVSATLLTGASGAVRFVVVNQQKKQPDWSQPTPGAPPLATFTLVPFGGLPDQGPQTADPKATADALRTDGSFLLALIQAYLDDDDLLHHAASSKAAAAACLSHFVFEVQGFGLADKPDLSFTDPSVIVGWTLRKQPDNPPTARPFRVSVEQRATGFYFRFGKDAAGDDPLGTDPVEQTERRIRLRRSAGPAPDPKAPIVRELLPLAKWAHVEPLPAPTPSGDGKPPSAPGGDGKPSPAPGGDGEPAPSDYQAIDPLGPTELVDVQLHYRVEVVDAHNHALFATTVSVQRERLDPPAAPDSASATLVFQADGTPALDLSVHWSSAGEPRLDRVDLELYAEERALDECGFYGDDDDLALLEIMREVDAGFDPDPPAGPPPPITDTFARLRGANDRRGLRLVWKKSVADVLGSAKVDTAQSIDLHPAISGHELDGWLAPTHGYRLHVGIRRGTSSPGAGCVSTLVACTHAVATAAPDRAVRVFQIERFPLADAGGRLLDPGRFSASIDDERRIRLTLSHGAPGIGGYRLLVRDGVAEDDGAPFEEADTLVVLPPLVAQYRPIQFEASAPWGLSSRAALLTGSIVKSPTGADLDTARKKLRDAVNALRVAMLWVRERSPSMPSGDKAAADPPAPPQGFLLSGGAGASSDVPDPQADWRVVGRLVQQLAAAGLAADLVVKESAPSEWWRTESWTELLTWDQGWRGIKILFARTRDGAWMRTVRLLAVPPDDWLGKNLPRPGPGDTTSPAARCWAFLEGPAIVALDDGARDPVRLTLQPGRRVAYTYDKYRSSAPADLWHHELEWAVQELDRYDALRRRLRGGAPEPPPPDVEPAQRRRVTVPRAAPVTDLAGVLPAPSRDETSIAFRVLESSERFASAANALARTRSGRIRVQLRPLRRFEDADAYLALVAKGWTPPDLATLRTQVVDPDGAPPVNPWRGVTWPATPPAARRNDRVPAPMSDLVELVDAPYFLVHGLRAWLSADDMAGPPSSAEQRRIPKVLGLVRRPRFEVAADGTLTIELIPSLLASHLTDDEWRALAADGAEAKPQPRLADYASAPPDPAVTSGGAPIHVLPDLRVEYLFFLNVGTADHVKAKALAQVAVKDATLRNPKDAIQHTPPLAPTSGFEAISAPDVLHPQLAPGGGFGALQLKCAVGSPDMKAALAEAAKEPPGVLSSRLWVSLRRGKLISELQALVPRVP